MIGATTTASKGHAYNDIRNYTTAHDKKIRTAANASGVRDTVQASMKVVTVLTSMVETVNGRMGSASL